MASPYIEGDDEIVAEYDVFLSTGLAGDVHIIQFPLRPFDRPYETTSIDLQVTNGIPTEESAAANTGLYGGSVPSGPTPTSRFHMNCALDSYGSESFLHQDQRSEESQFQFEYSLGSVPFSSRSSYAIGLLKGDALHLCPVQSVQQFTPKVRSKVTQRNQVPAPPSATLAVGAAHSSVVGDALSISGSTMRSRERDMLRATRSYMLNADAETAQQLVFYGIDTPESMAKKAQLACSTIAPSMPKPGAQQPTSTTTAYFPQDYLLDVGVEVAKKLILRPGGHSRAEHLADLVKSSQVITTQEVIDAMAQCGFHHMTEQDVVTSIREYAHYIHGVWVSRFTGVKISHPQLREIILLQFVASESGSLKRSSINRLVTRNDPALLNSILAILNSVAKLSESSAPEDRIWTLNKITSKEEVARFTAAFPQDAHTQREYWERRRPVIQDLLAAVNAGRSGAGVAGSGSTGGGGTGPRVAPQQQHAPGTSSSASHTSGHAAAANAAPAASQHEAQIRSFVRTLFLEHGVVGKQFTKQLILRNSKEQRSPFFGATPAAMGDACRHELEGFTESTFILQSANIKEIDAYRKYLVAAAKEKQQFAATDVVDRAQSLIESDFSSRGSIVPPDMLPIPKTVSQKVISEIATYQIGEKLWHLKRGFDGQ